MLRCSRCARLPAIKAPAATTPAASTTAAKPGARPAAPVTTTTAAVPKTVKPKATSPTVTDRELQRIPLGDESLHKLRVDSLKKLLEQGKIDVAFSYLEKVKEKGFIPTREVYEMMITQLLEKEATEEALGVYFEAKEKGMQVAHTLLPRLLEAAVANGADMTKEVFEDIKAHGAPSRDQYQAMIVSLVEEGRGAEAIDFLFEAKKLGMPLEVSEAEIIAELGEDSDSATAAYEAVKKYTAPSHDVLRALLSVYAADDAPENVAKVEKHLAEMKKYGLDKPDIFVYEQQLLTYASADRPEKCVELFETLQKDGLTPTVSIYNHMIAAYTKEKEQALSWLQKMQDAGLKPNEDTYLILMEIEAERGDWEAMRARFDDIKRAGLPPSQSGFALLVHYANEFKKYEETLKLLEEMRVEGVYPTKDIVSDLITAADEVGGADRVLVQLAAQSAELAQELMGFDPQQTEAYTKWLAENQERQARGEAPMSQPQFTISEEKIEELKKKYDDLNQELLELDSEVYFNVCEVLNKRGRIWDVIKIFEEMKQDGIMPDPVFYVSLIKWCQAAKLENEALDLQMEMDMMGYTREDVEAAEAALAAAERVNEEARAGRDPTAVMREMIEKVAAEKMTQNFAAASDEFSKLRQDRLRKPAIDVSPNVTKKFGLESILEDVLPADIAAASGTKPARPAASSAPTPAAATAAASSPATKTDTTTTAAAAEKTTASTTEAAGGDTAKKPKTRASAKSK